MEAWEEEVALTPAGLPRSWSREEVEQAFGITSQKIDELIKSGQVGYILGKNRKRRFMAEHIGQIRDAIEVKPAEPLKVTYDELRAMGVTHRSALSLAKKSK